MLKTITLLFLLLWLPKQPCQRADIILLLDYSGSVLGYENYVADAALAFINHLDVSEETVRIGIVSFNGASIVEAPLSGDRALLTAAVNELRMYTASGGTNIMDGLQTAYVELTNAPKSSTQIIILVTDGAPTINKNKTLPTANEIRSMGCIICGVLVSSSDMDGNYLDELTQGCYTSTNYVGLARELKRLQICL